MKGKRRTGCVWFLVLAMLVSLMGGMTGNSIHAEAAGGVKTKKITLNTNSVTMQIGDKMNLKVTAVAPARASKNVTWKSTNKKVVSVTKKGVIQAKKKGSAVITARAKKGKAVVKCRIKVNKNSASKSKILVAYFSATNTTKGVAEKISKVSGGDLYRITPAKKYTSDDLNYNNDSCRANKEQKNKKARPGIKGKCAGVQKYDVVFVGFPIWWGDTPRIVNTFMESYDFAGKTVIPFCTSGSSGIGTAEKTLKTVTKGRVTWRAGKRFEGDVPQSEVEKWFDGLEINVNLSKNETLVQSAAPELSAALTRTAEPSREPSVTPAQTLEPSREPSVTPAQTAEPSEEPGAEPTPEPQNKILAVYFSCTNNTKNVAGKIAAVTGADLYEIVPAVPYTTADLNYNDNNSRANREQNDTASRPEIAGNIPELSQYDTIFIGYPIWWGKAPRIMATFVESCDFTGKTVIPFCTSGSSGIGSSATNLHALCKDAGTWKDGKRFSGSASESEVNAWIEGLGLLQNEEVQKTEPVQAENKMMKIQVGDEIFTAELAENSSAEALAEKLKEGPLTIAMHDYGNFEKVGPLGFDLPRNDEQITTEPGDIILYQGNQITIYYDTNSWNFTRLGKIQGITGEELKAALGEGDVTVTLLMEG